jgi:uncharacterized protein YjbI with pentapeptide repeats
MSSMVMDNINNIEYLSKVLDDLIGYGIDVSKYRDELDGIVSKYESDKKKKVEVDNKRLEGEIYLNIYSDCEMELFTELAKLEFDLKEYINILDLMRITDDWDLDKDIDNIFYRLDNNMDNLLENIYSIDVRKIIISKYYDLLLMKIIKDYKEGIYGLLDKYDNNDVEFSRNVYLQDSIKRYIACNNIDFTGDISNYNLRDIVDKVCNNDKDKNKLLVSYNEIVVRENNNISFLEKIKNNLLLYQCKITFRWLGNVDRLELRKRFGCDDGDFSFLDKLKDKDLFGLDLEGIDLSSVDFTDAFITYTNLKNTRARINPQKVRDKTMFMTNVEGCYVLNNFEGYKEENISNLDGAILVDNFEKIDEIEKKLFNLDDSDFKWLGNVDRLELLKRVGYKKLKEKDFCRCNLENLDLSSVDFDSVDIGWSFLNNTGSKIDFLKVKGLCWPADVKNCYVINSDCSPFSSCDGSIHVDSFEEIDEIENKLFNLDNSEFSWLGNADRREILNRVGYSKLKNKDFSYVNLEGIDLSSVDFIGVNIFMTNLYDTMVNAESSFQKYGDSDSNYYRVYKIYADNYKYYCKLDGCYVSKLYNGYWSDFTLVRKFTQNEVIKNFKFGVFGSTLDVEEFDYENSDDKRRLIYELRKLRKK